MRLKKCVLTFLRKLVQYEISFKFHVRWKCIPGTWPVMEKGRLCQLHEADFILIHSQTIILPGF